MALGYSRVYFLPINYISSELLLAHQLIRFMNLKQLSFPVKFSHQNYDPTNPVVYFHFEEDQGWTNHGAQIMTEATPFDNDVRFWDQETPYLSF